MSFEDTECFFVRVMKDVVQNMENLLLTPNEDVTVKLPLGMNGERGRRR